MGKARFARTSARAIYQAAKSAPPRLTVAYCVDGAASYRIGCVNTRGGGGGGGGGRRAGRRPTRGSFLYDILTYWGNDLL